MKSVKSIYILLVVVFVFGSCHDELLSPVPESVLTTSNAFNTSGDIDLGVLGVYNSLQSKVQKDYLLMEMTSDNMYAEYYATEPGLAEVEVLEVSSENNILNNFWKTSYNGIFRANSILANIDNPTDYVSGEKEQYSGEASFLRGLFYFDLARIFGDVPLVTEILSVSEAEQIGRTSKSEVLNQVIADLKEAINTLPNPEDIERGRASKAAAMALLGKVYVHMEDWANAQTYLGQVVNDFNYSLVGDFKSLFSLETESNSEAIYSVTFIEGTNGQGITYAFAPLGGIYGYLNNGSRVGRPSWDLHQLFEEGDQRFEVTISETQLTANSQPDDDPIWYPYVNKYIVPMAGSSSGLDLPIMRLGDVLLLYAEALYKNGDSDGALQQINAIRERAFGNNSMNIVSADIGDEESFMDVLLLERRLELAFENQRWFDLVRSGRFTNELSEFETEYNPGSGQAEIQRIDVQPYMQYFPVPYEQIQLAAPGVLSQNDGY
ncbi:RagB/SusD family nutrient uptake outer membrane protein [Membranihabitans maritimus]|uniref:RagB/SusD family nutrient uptake outer membrane protein n=1 Tax=Membranihabitans maritimus TaxID=2904244 RepID=UPI001F268F21|nr:RagB/SusD family nutrient uptake outer membrane protein [Membranihabitans maritimus]